MHLICFVTTKLIQSGPTNQLFYQCKYLSRYFGIHIITLDKEMPGNTSISKFRFNGIQITQLKLGFFKSLILGRLKLWKILRSCKYKAIFSFGFRPDLLMYNLEKSIHYNIIRINPNYSNPHKFGKIALFFMIYIHKLILRNSSNNITVSYSLKNILLFNHNIISDVVPNGINHHIYYPEINRTVKKKLRNEKLGNSYTNEILFLSVGSLIERKNVIELVEFFSKVTLRNIKLVIIGDGPLYKKIKKMKPRNVVFLRYIADVIPYYKMADYYISSSHSEGFPNAVLEALSSGLPVMLSEIEMHKEFFYHPTNSIGVTYKIGDFDNFEKNLVKLLEMKYMDLSIVARKVIEENYSISIMGEKYRKIINQNHLCPDVLLKNAPK